MTNTDKAAPRAVVLLSGGLDSATTLALAVRDGYVCHALSFRYGQRHAVELEAAHRVAEALGAAEHKVLDLPIGALGGSALTDGATGIPLDRSEAEMAGGIPATYVPARNTIFLALALGYAEVIGAEAVFIGVNAVDYSLTVSCYDPDPEGRACGRCDSCRLRRKGFSEAGVADPTPYAPSRPRGGTP